MHKTLKANHLRQKKFEDKKQGVCVWGAGLGASQLLEMLAVQT